MQTAPQTGITNDYALSLKRESLFLDRESHLEPQIQHSGLSLYGQDPAIGGGLSSGLGRTAAAFVTQVRFMYTYFSITANYVFLPEVFSYSLLYDHKVACFELS